MVELDREVASNCFLKFNCDMRIFLLCANYIEPFVLIEIGCIFVLCCVGLHELCVILQQLHWAE